jgi:MFS transporter, ENTS family, enterobactin (siderophore) exporter
MATSAAVPGSETKAADRNPFAGSAYRWWWAMTFCVSVAIGVQIVTVPTYVLDRTDTRFFVALAVICQTVPTALFTLVGGASADRIGQKRILRVTLAIAAGTSAVFVVLSALNLRQIWPVFIIAAVVGASAAFQNPSRQSLINRLAPGARLQNGVIWGTLAFMGGQSFLGPAVGGFSVRAFGQTTAFAVEVALLVGAGFCASCLVIPAQSGPSGPRISIIGTIRAGLSYVRANERLWQVLTLGVVPGLCFMGVTQATFPVFARDVFGRGAEGIAMMSASMGTGTLIGSVLLAKWGPRDQRGRWLIRALPVGGTIMLLVGLAPNLPVAMALLVLWGFSAAVFINFASTLLQTYAEPAYIGRVMSIYSLCVLGAMPLGNLHAGIGLELTDPRVVMVYSGVVAAALGVFAFLTFRTVRTLD